MKTFEIELSWMMSTNIFVEAETVEEAEQYAASMGHLEGGNFVPLSIDVGSVEEVVAVVKEDRARLFRVK